MNIKRFEFNMFPVNCYVLCDNGEAVIIDAGCYYPEEQQKLKSYITDNQLTVKYLLDTHAHLDHIFGNPFLLREFGLRACASHKDEFWIPRTGEMARMFGFQLNEEPVALGDSINDGDEFCFGNSRLKAIATPGHSPGSMTFYCEKDKCLFCGDALFKGSIGRTDLPGGDFDELRESICSRLFTLPEDTIVYPGHGDPTTIGREKMNNPYFR